MLLECQRGPFTPAAMVDKNSSCFPILTSLIVHRINIDVPGTDIFTSDIAPFVLIKKIMNAYRGNDVDTAPSDPEAKRTVAQKRLLDDYGRTAQNYGRSFVGFKKGLGVCALILISGTIVWPLLFVYSKVAWSGNGGC